MQTRKFSNLMTKGEDKSNAMIAIYKQNSIDFKVLNMYEKFTMRLASF